MPVWQELSWPRIKECAEKGLVVIIPIGVIEQHGHHLPLDTDAFFAQEMARAAARRDPEILVGPTVPFGFTPSNKNFPGSISLSAATWTTLIREIVRSVHRHGFTRIALLNGHGGQVALSRSAVSALQDEEGIRIVVLNWFGLVNEDMDRLFPDENMPGGRVGHAGAVETSINQYLRGELAAQGSLETHLGPQMPDFVRRVGGYIQTPREDLSPSGVMGDPNLASPEKGGELFELCVERLCAFAREYRESE